MTANQGRPVRSLGDALRRLTAELGLGEVHTLARLQDAWTETVGGDVASHARPVRLRDGTLTVEADDPGWGSQLRYLGDDLARRLNQALGTPVVEQIRVVVARPRSDRR